MKYPVFSVIITDIKCNRHFGPFLICLVYFYRFIGTGGFTLIVFSKNIFFEKFFSDFHSSLFPSDCVIIDVNHGYYILNYNELKILSEYHLLDVISSLRKRYINKKNKDHSPTFLNMIVKRPMTPCSMLTSKEFFVITAFCEGRSISSIAWGLGITNKSVHYIKYKALSKLNVDSLLKLMSQLACWKEVFKMVSQSKYISQVEYKIIN